PLAVHGLGPCEVEDPLAVRGQAGRIGQLAFRGEVIRLPGAIDVSPADSDAVVTRAYAGQQSPALHRPTRKPVAFRYFQRGQLFRGPIVHPEGVRELPVLPASVFHDKQPIAVGRPYMLTAGASCDVPRQ